MSQARALQLHRELWPRRIDAHARRAACVATARRADELALREPTRRQLLEVCRTLRDEPELQLRDADGSGRRRLSATTAAPSGSTTRATAQRLQPRASIAPRRTRSAGDRRFAVVYNLLSITHNQRLRLRVWCAGHEEPVVDSVTDGLGQRQLVRARGLRPVRHPVPRPSGPAPHPHRLRLHRPSVPQGFPADRQRRGALRPGEEARGLPAGEHRAARAGAAR